MNITTKKQAVQFTHTLSATSKMPCKSYSLPASACNVGSKLRDIPGSTCSGCYAHKGCYNWNSTQSAMHKRLDMINGPHWVAGMVKQLAGHELFRWHDSGDIQSMQHLQKIVEICELTPGTSHWLPTREHALINRYMRAYGAFPDNLNVRISSTMIDAKPKKLNGINTSTVHQHSDAIGFECNAPMNNGECGDCRACWNKDIPNISYAKH